MLLGKVWSSGNISAGMDKIARLGQALGCKIDGGRLSAQDSGSILRAMLLGVPLVGKITVDLVNYTDQCLDIGTL